MRLKQRIQRLVKLTNLSNKEQKISQIRVPIDPKEFYNKLGPLDHQTTHQPVTNLTKYQIDAWRDAFKHKYRLIIKSQKIGLTTSCLMEDFQRAILPSSHPLSCRGKEILIIAQTFDMAKEHLYTLRKIIMNSSFKDFLITIPTSFLLKTETTKASVLFIANPENPNKPTRIIARGPRASSIWSWKEVKHIHMSDIVATNQIDDSQLFGAAFSRLANTDGSLLIETPPIGQRGYVWEIYKQSTLEDDENFEAGKFHLRKIPAAEAVFAGVISQKFLDQEKERRGILYAQLYECEFVNPFNTWYDDSLFQYDRNLQLDGGENNVLA